MNPLEWTGIFRSHRGKWLAFKPDHQTVVGTGDTLKAAKRAAEKRGCRDPILTRMPRTLPNFIGSLK
jgi:hypothetical protein